MADNSEVLTLLAKLVTKHETTINALAIGIGDVVMIARQTVANCDKPDCKNKATVTRVSDTLVIGEHAKQCDHHAAIDIVNKRSTEENWVEVANAEPIRRLDEFANVLINNIPVVPTFH